jgi:hypothetical protein
MPPVTQPAPTVPNGPLARYLLHPGAETARLLHHLAHFLGALGMDLGPPLLRRRRSLLLYRGSGAHAGCPARPRPPVASNRG